jgi:hypothetical protein
LGTVTKGGKAPNAGLTAGAWFGEASVFKSRAVKWRRRAD